MSKQPQTASDRLRRVQESFHRALSLSGDDLAEFLKSLAVDEPEINNEVRRLLVHHNESDDYLDPLWSELGSMKGDSIIGAGDTVGAYRLINKIDSGGSGVVWVGERADGVFEQRVAVKLLSWGLVSARLRARFDAERRTLAQLEHPYVARLIDGGTTDEGISYLVMEFVEGVPIDVFCRERNLSLGQKLALFQKVCDGVRYAHAHLVVHCDLTPNNILVTNEHNPKLVDFGLSRLLAEVDDARRVESRDARVAFTPIFASPEQRRGAVLTTATDVYSLGVILSVLLQEDSSRNHPVKQVECREGNDPYTNFRAMLSTLPRELRCIIEKATRVEPEHRYALAEEISEELRRFLEGFPVLAHPQKSRYRVKKFVRRHAVVASLVLALAVATLAGAIGLSISLARARANAHAAEASRREAAATAEFLTEILVSVDPLDKKFKGPEYTVRELVEDAASRLPGKLAEFPRVQVELQSTLGQTYRSLGMYDEAVALFRFVLKTELEYSPVDPTRIAIAYRKLGEALLDSNQLEEAELVLGKAKNELLKQSDVDLHEKANVLENLGELLAARGKYDDAVRFLQKARCLREVHSSDLDLAHTLHRLGRTLLQQADYHTAVDPLRQALRIRNQILGEHHSRTANTMSLLGYCLAETNHADEARQLLTAAVTIQRRNFGSDSPGLSESLNLLALFHNRRGELDDAELLFREVVAIDRKSLPPGHPNVAAALNNLGQNLRKQKRYEDAAAVIKVALESLISSYGREHPTVASSMGNLGANYAKLGRLDDALKWIRESHEVRRTLYGDDHAHTLESLVELSSMQIKLGNFEKGRELALRGLEVSQTKYPTAIKRAIRFQVVLGNAQVGLGDYQGAEITLKSVCTQASEKLGPHHPATKYALRGLIHNYETWGKPDQAASIRDRLQVVDND